MTDLSTPTLLARVRRYVNRETPQDRMQQRAVLEAIDTIAERCDPKQDQGEGPPAYHTPTTPIT